MQSKINSFFKPTSSPLASSSAVSASGPTDQPPIKGRDGGDDLAIWEESRHVVVNIYERRSSIADRRSEANEECIENSANKHLSRERATSASKNLKKKRSYAQFHLELGQSDFLLKSCSTCGVKYAPGDEVDEMNHKTFHKNYVHGVPFKGWRNERAFIMPSSKEGRIVMVSENDSPAHRKKLEEVVKLMEVELSEDWILHKHCKLVGKHGQLLALPLNHRVQGKKNYCLLFTSPFSRFMRKPVAVKYVSKIAYLFISSQRVAGCLVAEPITEAFKLIPRPEDETHRASATSKKLFSHSTTIQFGNFVLQREVLKKSRPSDCRLNCGAIVCEEEAKPADCGIRAIWITPSNRRKGIATHLLDTLRKSFCDGCLLEKSQLALSQPSSLGIAFASTYFETSSFLVYKA